MYSETNLKICDTVFADQCKINLVESPSFVSLQICSQLSDRLEKQQTAAREELQRIKVCMNKPIQAHCFGAQQFMATKAIYSKTCGVVGNKKF